MSRNLHITIVEGAAPSRRGRVSGPSLQAGSDPEGNYVMPPPEDPEGNYVMPPPEDPDGNYVMPPPEDPEGNYVMPPPEDPAGGGHTFPGAPVGAVYAWSGPAQGGGCGCCCKDGDSKTTPPERPGLPPGAYSGFVIVRMAAGVPPSFATLWDFARAEPGLPALKAVLELEIGQETADQQLAARELGTADRRAARHLQSRPLIELRDYSRERTEALIKGLESGAATSRLPPLHSLTAYWRVDLRPFPERVLDVVAAFNALPEVDLAYRELTATDPASGGQVFAEDQGYLEDAPAGISAGWAWKALAEAALTQSTSALPKLTVCDLEQAWRPDHLDLEALKVPEPFYGANRASLKEENAPGHHGTAVLGQLAAADNVKGAAADYGRFVLSSHFKSKNETEAPKSELHPFAGTNGHVAAAIVGALVTHLDNPKPLELGDVLLLEVQRGLRPTEIDAADFDAIRLASARGVIVVEAAGNGGFNLDAGLDPDTGRSFRRGDSRFRDSGAIFVGASRAAVPHDRALFSNYGSRLDCFAWGEAVTSCGYGDLAGKVVTDYYTNTFSGTSSASPIIAAAAALVQALHHGTTGQRLEPLAMRALLSDPATGTRQGPKVAGFIGVMPDLKAITRGRLALVPDVTMRRHVGDDGSRPGPDEEVSSSPDILLWNGDSLKAAERFGEGPRANTPAPGTPLDPAKLSLATGYSLYVRLRNRGGSGGGTTQVRLFACPATTLITPELWTPMGSLDVGIPPQGDTLEVSKPYDWVKALKANLAFAGALPPQVPPQPLSFLAVLQPAQPIANSFGYDARTGLPPGGSYFDWAEFRRFLRGPGVAWRNAHAIAVKPGESVALRFLIAGTPDHSRHFDFEIVQRLPEKAQVRITVGNAFAAKLRQRQPLPPEAVDKDNTRLELPGRSRFTFGQVRIAAGVVIDASFEVKPTSPAPLKRGHSLAIRQLWKGEEVGRITWWFVEPGADG